MTRIVVVCGPTASGKSFLALRLAESLGAVVVNADALQVYKQLPVITASPQQADLMKARHFLYNYVDVTRDYSVAEYISEASSVIYALPHEQDVVVVGGSGMYISSLIYGSHKLPTVDKALRAEILAEVENHGILALYAKLSQEDPLSSAEISPNDTKRVMRSYEVFRQTGKTIKSFYTDENLHQPLAGYDITVVYLEPEREFLYSCCDVRFNNFIEHGALEEARELLNIWDSVNISAQKALGLREIVSYLRGEVSLPDAVGLAQQKTRNFAKRQITWFANQLKNRRKITFNNIDEFYRQVNNLVADMQNAKRLL